MIKSLSRMGTWKTYSIDDGLASLRIEHIAEDREGSIWFAAWDNGASRFDGDEFQNFTTRDGLVLNMAMSTPFQIRLHQRVFRRLLKVIFNDQIT